ncbi:MAG: hypothetical protein J6V50_03625 [Clostridia bacterium]|nr:hypothetical protein [Clostridia bacterium]
MKAINLFSDAAILAGESSPDELLKKAGVGLINTILTDLKKPPISSLTDEIEFSRPTEYTAISNGVAMLICLYLGDDAGIAVMSELYINAKKRLLKNTGNIKNTVFGG